MTMRQLNISQKMLFLVIVLFGVGTLGFMGFVNHSSKQSTVANSVEQAKSTINQFKTLRSYYTANIVKKVKSNSDLKISFDHHQKDDTIPLPATMIHDLSEIFGTQNNGLKLKLYSDYPFPNRKSRELDTFMEHAIKAFKEGNSEIVIEEAHLDGLPYVRVAIPDKMVAQACVDCHNNHPDTPKNDWALGDVRGILEVQTPIQSQVANNEAMMLDIAGFSLVWFVILGALVSFAFSRWISRPLKTNIQHLSQIGSHVDQVSDTIRTSSDSLAVQSGSQAAALEETSASIEEMSSMTRSNAEHAVEARELANEATQAAQKGAIDLKELCEAMEAIKKSSQNISSIIQTIDEIAFQTNILALNAAVEAARAGSAGEGFSVVADEVRNLAQRSAQAAKETSACIEDSIKQSEWGVEIHTKVVKNLGYIQEKTEVVNKIVSGISDACQEQNMGIEQIKTATIELEGNTQSNADAADQSASTVKNLKEQCIYLKQTIGDVRNMVHGGADAFQIEEALPRSGNPDAYEDTPSEFPGENSCLTASSHAESFESNRPSQLLNV